MLSAPSPVSAAASPPSENVYHAVGEWTLRHGNRLLAAWAIAGWLDAVGVAILLPGWWLLAMPLLSISSIGVWGLASHGSRSLEAAQPAARLRQRALRAVRTAAVVIGTLAAITGFYGAFLLVLGRRWGPSGG